ncbi:NfeD family protein [Spirulina subsalsa FACHB-351]|uniref:NfeD family protein n=1 Tax=Spirulina subsalsa FACHB-351 TaxID=234711 RepID=A0ABT3L4D0_9CYAN|nr:NfeD family protein [Spirulina subsalsa]MCW6036359.1 NfeD family protein [Spirulina subsalsa FACHB-351]
MTEFWQHFPAQFHQRSFSSGDRTSLREWQAVVTQRITPQQIGQVRYRGTWWRAACMGGILEEGDVVYVVGRSGTTLWVEQTGS